MSEYPAVTHIGHLADPPPLHHHHHHHHDPHDDDHHHHGHPHHLPPQPAPQYGTFPGSPEYSHPVMGFPQPVPQPVPPPGFAGSYPPPHPSLPQPPYYDHGYQSVPGVHIVEGRPLREPSLPCCGISMGWLLFIIGFFLAAIPWYVGAFMVLCTRVDHREKPGYVACAIAAALATIVVIFGATKGLDDDW